MSLTVEQKAEILKEFGQGENDTGSPEVQVALLTKTRLNYKTTLKNIRKITTHVVVCYVWLAAVVSFLII